MPSAATILVAAYPGDKISMATYTCDKCGMSVDITCAKCGEELVADSIEKQDGTKVQVSVCPEGHGKIKSPMCCGQDMTCEIG